MYPERAYSASMLHALHFATHKTAFRPCKYFYKYAFDLVTLWFALQIWGHRNR